MRAADGVLIEVVETLNPGVVTFSRVIEVLWLMLEALKNVDDEELDLGIDVEGDVTLDRGTEVEEFETLNFEDDAVLLDADMFALVEVKSAILVELVTFELVDPPGKLLVVEFVGIEFEVNLGIVVVPMILELELFPEFDLTDFFCVDPKLREEVCEAVESRTGDEVTGFEVIVLS